MYGYGCFDHYGNEFASIEDMCRAWRISPATLRGRLAAGWDLGAALETPIRRHNRNRNYRYVRTPWGSRIKVR